MSGRSGVSFVLKAAGLLSAAVLCSCAGKKAGLEAPDSDERPLAAMKTKEADDLRKYIDKFDPLTDTEDGAPRAVLDPPKGADAGSYSDLEKLIDTTPIPAMRPEPKAPAAAPASAPATPEAIESSDAMAVFGPPAPEGSAEARETVQQRMARQVGELRQTMQELRSSGDSSSAEALELLALRMLDADASGPELDAVKQKLSAGQLRALSALESLLIELRAEDAGSAALDSRRLAKLLGEHADKLAESRPVRITSSALCTSVQSYGCYTKFPDYTFLQGRSQPVIVYVALENFTQRGSALPRADDAMAGTAFNPPSAKEREKKDAAGRKDRKAPAHARQEAAPAGEVVVELTETITIHNDADDLIVWRAPEASVRDVSRDRRKDYYLVQRIELPARLTLGKYNVKVSVRDVATGATDETLIPIEIVADPGLASAR